MQPATQVHRQQAKHATEQERDTPGVVRHLFRAIQGVDGGGDQRSEQNTGGQAAGQGAAGVADMPWRHVFRHNYPRPRHLAADRRALDDAHQQQQQRRPEADLRISRQQAHDQGRHGHHEDAQGEHLLAPQQVAEVRHDDAAQRTRQVAGGKDAEGLHHAQPLGHVDGEEQLPDHGGEKHENNEVVELQRPAQGGQRQGFIVVAGQRARRLRTACRHGGHGKASLISQNGRSGVLAAPGRVRQDSKSPGKAHQKHSCRKKLHYSG